MQRHIQYVSNELVVLRLPRTQSGRVLQIGCVHSNVEVSPIGVESRRGSRARKEPDAVTLPGLVVVVDLGTMSRKAYIIGKTQLGKEVFRGVGLLVVDGSLEVQRVVFRFLLI